LLMVVEEECGEALSRIGLDEMVSRATTNGGRTRQRTEPHAVGRRLGDAILGGSRVSALIVARSRPRHILLGHARVIFLTRAVVGPSSFCLTDWPVPDV